MFHFTELFIIGYYNNLNAKYLVVWWWHQFLLADILQPLRGCHHWDVTCCKLVPHSLFSAGIEAVPQVPHNTVSKQSPSLSEWLWLNLTWNERHEGSLGDVWLHWDHHGTLLNHQLSNAIEPLVLEGGNHLLPLAEPAIILPSLLTGLCLLLC